MVRSFEWVTLQPFSKDFVIDLSAYFDSSRIRDSTQYRENSFAECTMIYNSVLFLVIHHTEICILYNFQRAGMAYTVFETEGHHIAAVRSVRYNSIRCAITIGSRVD